MVAITIHNARVRFQQQVLFDHLNFDLPAGQITCLLGSSGVGKSTLCRLLAHLPLGAQTQVQADIRTSDHKPIVGRVSYLAQQDGLMPWLTAMDNVLLPVRLQGLSVKSFRSKAQALLLAVGLPEAAGLKPSQLSGGMRQRVALARTLLLDNPIVLLDEPFSALDAVTRYRLQDLAVRLLKGKTVLLITHDPLEALRMAQRIVVIGQRPARVLKTLDLSDLPTPRSIDHPMVVQQQSTILKELALEAGS